MIEWIVSSSILILIVIALRTVFKGKISLQLQYAIWALVLVRLLIPFSFGSANISVNNLTNTVQQQKVVADIGNLHIPSQSYEDAYNQVVQHYESQGIDVESLHGSELEELEYEVYERMEGKALSEIVTDIAKAVWLTGIVAVSAVFFTANAIFRRKLLRSSADLGIKKEKLSVYVSAALDTPCLFGIFRPAIYVTSEVADDPTLLRHTMEHEATHHRHGDHIWAMLRCICLMLHWYNPLVWWTALLSQRDAELACDEATIRQLGEEERAEYGRTLIGMTVQKKANVLITATTMTASKRSIKERILLIAKKPKMAIYTLVIVILVAAVAVGCTFTGARKDEKAPAPVTLTGTKVFASDPEITAMTIYAPGAGNTLVDPAYLPEMVQWALGFEYGNTVQPNTTMEPGSNTFYVTLYYADGTEQTAHLDYETVDGTTYAISREDAPTCWLDIWEAEETVEPVHPEDIPEIKSATLYWNGEHTVNDQYALNKIQTLIANSRQLESASCWFTAQLVLELKSGETKTIFMATDRCATWMSEGEIYHYGELTEDGLTGNEEFYSLFAPAVIRDKSKEGMGAVYEYLEYLNWSRYANQYGSEETFALMGLMEKWAAEDPTSLRFGNMIHWMTGLDGAYADYYAGVLTRLYDLAPSEFAWACLGNATDDQEVTVLSLLSYRWSIPLEQTRAKLEAELPQS